MCAGRLTERLLLAAAVQMVADFRARAILVSVNNLRKATDVKRCGLKARSTQLAHNCAGHEGVKTTAQALALNLAVG